MSKGGWFFSVLLHVGVVLAVVLGLPSLFESDALDEPIVVSVVAIVDEAPPPEPEPESRATPEPPPAEEPAPMPERRMSMEPNAKVRFLRIGPPRLQLASLRRKTGTFGWKRLRA